jgi:hypothetical protein
VERGSFRKKREGGKREITLPGYPFLQHDAPMHPKRFFLLLFIVALAVTAVLAIAVILIGKPNEMETKILLSTMSIGAYSAHANSPI